MKSSALVAVIHRVPGGAFAKGPRTASMPAFPVHTTLANLSTYFNPWPVHRSKFLLYGSSRCSATCSNGWSLKELQGSLKCSRSNGGAGLGGSDGARAAGGVGAEPMHLYGASPIAPAGDGGAGGLPKTIGLAGVAKRFREGQKLTMITAYDFPSARFACNAGVEFVLVGDSLGNCRLGLPDTVGVTMEDMCRATTAVRRGVEAGALSFSISESPQVLKPLVIGDMPFGSYMVEADALRNAATFRVAGADLVKLEGGAALAPLVKSLTTAGIAVVAHIGLEPQRAFLQGGLKMQGTDADAALSIVQDAQALVAAGAVAVVIECVPVEVGRAVQLAVGSVPVIGIGAGGDVAGQVLVCDDLLGMHGRPPSFVKRYADLATATVAAYESYKSDVRSGAFPAAAHSRQMKPAELVKLQAMLAHMGVELPDSAHVAAAGTAAPMPTAAWTLSSAAARQMSPLLHAQQMPRLLGARAFANGDATQACGNVAVLRSFADMRSWRSEATGRVALVPTMGNLHEGHLELVDLAKQHADNVLVSIFVNPAQFAAHEDLDTYPRTFEKDLDILRERGASAVLAPLSSEVYPNGSPGPTTVVPRFVEGLSEAASRTHFFEGVATVCLKLFNLCEPDVVIFGQKDGMQCAVIANMLESLLLAHRIHLVIAPTSREADGLARSSRNTYLTTSMRRSAPAIYAALMEASSAPGATPESVRAGVRSKLEGEGMEVQYVSVADMRTMQEKGVGSPLANSMISIACLLRDGSQQCRLIDNIVMPAVEPQVDDKC